MDGTKEINPGDNCRLPAKGNLSFCEALGLPLGKSWVGSACCLFRHTPLSRNFFFFIGPGLITLLALFMRQIILDVQENLPYACQTGAENMIVIHFLYIPTHRKQTWRWHRSVNMSRYLWLGLLIDGLGWFIKKYPLRCRERVGPSFL